RVEPASPHHPGSILQQLAQAVALAAAVQGGGNSKMMEGFCQKIKYDRDGECGNQNDGLMYIKGARLNWLLDIGWGKYRRRVRWRMVHRIQRRSQANRRKTIELLNQFGREDDAD